MGILVPLHHPPHSQTMKHKLKLQTLIIYFEAQNFQTMKHKHKFWFSNIKKENWNCSFSFYHPCAQFQFYNELGTAELLCTYLGTSWTVMYISRDQLNYYVHKKGPVELLYTYPGTSWTIMYLGAGWAIMYIFRDQLNYYVSRDQLNRDNSCLWISYIKSRWQKLACRTISIRSHFFLFFCKMESMFFYKDANEIIW